MPEIRFPENREAPDGEGFMRVTRRSCFTGRVHTRRMPVGASQFQAWRTGTLIQFAFTNLSADEREFLMTGATPAEWTKVFPS